MRPGQRSRNTVPCSRDRHRLFGAVLESYGAGNAPRREDLLSAFREAAERGVVMVNVSQCITGAVADIYETGKALAAYGFSHPWCASSFC